jgi:dihydropteroate synthase
MYMHTYKDVSGGLLDKEMFTAAADLQVPICLMHYRGDPSTMVYLNPKLHT